jgi:hypothetical protein
VPHLKQSLRLRWEVDIFNFLTKSSCLGSSIRLQSRWGLNLNLEWLQYVCYILLACTFILYIAARIQTSGIGRSIKFAVAFLCLFLAALAWEFQESNAGLHSPRKVISGNVTYVSANGHKSGSIDDDFQLQFPDGSFSPIFSTDILASSRSAQPIHKGDHLMVSYRTWDTATLEIDELAGQRPGWHYVRNQSGWGRTITAGIVEILSLLWLLREYLRSRNGEELTYPTDNAKPQPSDVQTLGL